VVPNIDADDDDDDDDDDDNNKKAQAGPCVRCRGWIDDDDADDDDDDIKPVKPTWAVGNLFRGARYSHIK